MTTISITGCKWCKKDHKDIEFHRMKSKLYDAGFLFTHYTICPDTKYMILITKEEAANAKLEKQDTQP